MDRVELSKDGKLLFRPKNSATIILSIGTVIFFMIFLASRISDGTFKLIHAIGVELVVILVSGGIWLRTPKEVVVSPFEITVKYPQKTISLPLESLREIELKQIYNNPSGSILEAAVDIVLASIRKANQRGEIVIKFTTNRRKVSLDIGTYSLEEIQPLFDYFEKMTGRQPEIKRKRNIFEFAIVWNWRRISD